MNLMMGNGLLGKLHSVVLGKDRVEEPKWHALMTGNVANKWDIFPLALNEISVE